MKIKNTEQSHKAYMHTQAWKRGIQQLKYMHWASWHQLHACMTLSITLGVHIVYFLEEQRLRIRYSDYIKFKHSLQALSLSVCLLSGSPFSCERRVATESSSPNFYAFLIPPSFSCSILTLSSTIRFSFTFMARAKAFCPPGLFHFWSCSHLYAWLGLAHARTIIALLKREAWQHT